MPANDYEAGSWVRPQIKRRPNRPRPEQSHDVGLTGESAAIVPHILPVTGNVVLRHACSARPMAANTPVAHVIKPPHSEGLVSSMM